METKVLDNKLTGGTVVIENNQPAPKKNYYSGLLSIGDNIDGYSIISQMNTNSGEAEIYICEKLIELCKKHYRYRLSQNLDKFVLKYY